MATILYSSTHGSDDPTRATIPFVMALGAVEAGHQAQIALIGEAAYLAKDIIVENVHGVGWPPLKELVAQAAEKGVRVFV
jgi:predicted peroxiredoxin